MIRNSTNQISIKPKMSAKVRAAIAVAAVLLMVIALYFSYRTGVRSGHSQYEQDAMLVTQLNQSIDQLRNQLEESEQQTVFAERQNQIQTEAYKQMSDAYASSEQKNRYLGSRLDFYRSIISPQGGQSGPAIQALDYQIETDAGESAITFNVTLVQAIKHKVHVTGNLVVELHVAGKKVAVWPSASSRSINYQYFQQISGVFESVKDFQDARIDVILNLHDGSSMQRSFKLEAEKSIIDAEKTS